MSIPRAFRPDPRSAAAVAQSLATQRKTCEGCAGLRASPRPMCRNEASPNFRAARDTYHASCAAYVVGGVQTPPAPETPPASRYAVAGEVVTGKKRKFGFDGNARRMV